MKNDNAIYREYLTATENEVLIYLEEIKHAANLRRYEHIKLLITDLKIYISHAAYMRKDKRRKKDFTQ